ncbi:putative F-box protein At5g60060 [Cucumis sativus]|uniref:F-box domain-containing protein n=1 Tax=Cucumis sativus TaxID=3659 RepID=A0A0A0KMS6_CUCSA|nr:putative F-box protein At5g60060 [Cucumis sativus]
MRVFIRCSACSRSTTIWSLWYHRLHLCDGTASITATTKSPVPWSDLPSELWELIGNRLETEIDIIRFRSVCTLWRQEVSLPFFYYDYSSIFTPHRKTIFHLIPIRRRRTYFSSSSNKQSKLHFTKLFSSRLMYDNEARGKESELNLLNFRINKVAESYTIKYIPRIRKIIVSPNFPGIITLVCPGGKLGFTKQEGNDAWLNITFIGENYYEDLIEHKKKIYAITRLGEIFKIIDSSMELIKLRVPPCGNGTPCGNGDQKHLVECGGEIYVVNRLVDYSLRVINFEVYRLDEEERRWVYVDNLGNYSFVLRKDCSFCVDEGVKRNCIYFNRIQDWRGTSSIDALFDLKDRKFIKLV